MTLRRAAVEKHARTPNVPPSQDARTTRRCCAAVEDARTSRPVFCYGAAVAKRSH